MGARARKYVAEYQKRGTIVPPSACEMCIRETERYLHGSRKLFPYHPDPAKVRDVAWLCGGCQIIARSSREPIEVSWSWPGLNEKRLRGPLPDPSDAKTAATMTADRFAPHGLQSLRESAYIATFIRHLDDRTRERLYADGIRAGALWTPYNDPPLDRLLRDWARREQQTRTECAIELGYRTLHHAELPTKPLVMKVEPTSKHLVFDQATFDRLLEKKLNRADEADRLADEVNAKAAAALERLTARR